MAATHWIQLLRVALLSALLVSTACHKKDAISESPKSWPAFDSHAAFDELENIVAFGSRAHGSTGHDYMAGYLQARLKSMGFETRLQSFTNNTPRGLKMFNNIEAVMSGKSDRIIIVSTHYDSMQNAAEDFQAANSAGSGPAILLELARLVKNAYRGKPEIRFVFFDGQEPLVRHSSSDGLRGSFYYAEMLIKHDDAKRVIAVINLDLVGDRNLTITIPENVSNELRRELIEASHQEDARKYFKLMNVEIGDDHEPFYLEHIPAINIVDFEYGSKPGRNDYFRTDEDTLDKISTESLDVIGRVTLRMVRNLSKKPHSTQKP